MHLHAGRRRGKASWETSRGRHPAKRDTVPRLGYRRLAVHTHIQPVPSLTACKEAAQVSELVPELLELAAGGEAYIYRNLLLATIQHQSSKKSCCVARAVTVSSD